MAAPLVCVLVPHFKDEYWLSARYGLERAAAREGVELALYEAGGYNARKRQIAQLETCAARQAEAILLGAVTSDHPELLEAVARAARQAPVIGLVNELHATDLTARIGVDWFEMGRAVGAYLKSRHPPGTTRQSGVLVTGPDSAGWTSPLRRGMRAGLAGSAVEITEVLKADTGLRQQLALVEEVLSRIPRPDYLIGSAPAIEAAMGLLAVHDDPGSPKLVSTYISHTVLRGLMNGTVLAAPFDDPARQGEMALERAREAIEAPGPADPGMSGPEIRLLRSYDPSLANVMVSPPEYFPRIE